MPLAYVYGRSVLPSSPLLQCLHTSAFEMDYPSRDIDGHSFRRIVFGFAHFVTHAMLEVRTVDRCGNKALANHKNLSALAP